MHKKSEGTSIDLPIILEQLNNTDGYKSIFILTKLRHLLNNTEHQEIKSTIPQSHQCQKFGHNQDYCYCLPKCVKCGRKHVSHHRKKPWDTTATFVSSRGFNPTNFRGYIATPRARPTKQALPAFQTKPAVRTMQQPQLQARSM